MKSARELFDIKNPVHFLALGFGSGLVPKAPGTAGTLMAIPVFLVLAKLPLFSYILSVTVCFLAGIMICNQASEDAGVHDHGAIVWDEFIGYWITMIPVIALSLPITWQLLLLGFVLFRIFDMLKPFPISYLDKKVSGGLGIMVDDVAAGIAAMLCLWAWIKFIN